MRDQTQPLPNSVETHVDAAEATGVELQRSALRAMTMAERLAVAAQLFRAARQFKEAGLRSLHPDLSDAEIRARVTRAFLDVRD